jgi:predicted TIM-barrel fold metal-dependent hydrolase
VRELTEDPLQAVERLFDDSMTHHPEVTKLARRVFDKHRVVFGSNWPFSSDAV